MSMSTECIVIDDRYLIPAGIHCVRCDQPLSYAEHGLACMRCDTLYELLDRQEPPDSCPECGGAVSWMGGILMCSPTPNPSFCSQGFVLALPPSPQSCGRCGSLLDWSNRASLCYECALRAYVELRPGAARIHALANASDDDWRETVGFGPNDSLWATSGPVAERSDYRSEMYAVGVGNAAYLPGQLLCSLPPWSSTGGSAGTVWLVRFCCPSGLVFEVAFPAGWIADETAAIDDVGKRRSALPQRVMEVSGISSTTIQRELGVARRIVNALPKLLGGQAPIDPENDAEIIIHTIKRLLANGDEPNKTRVGQLIYPRVKSPYDSLKKQLARIRERSGHEWEDLLRAAKNH